MNELDGIKQFTTVVADSGDIESIRHYHPQDATTNPSLLLKAAGLSQYEHLIDDAIAWGKKNGKTQHFRAGTSEENIRAFNHIIEGTFAVIHHRICGFGFRHVWLTALIDNAF